MAERRRAAELQGLLDAECSRVNAVRSEVAKAAEAADKLKPHEQRAWWDSARDGCEQLDDARRDIELREKQRQRLAKMGMLTD